MSPLECKFGASQIIIVTNFVVVSSVGIKKVDCILKHITNYLPIMKLH